MNKVILTGRLAKDVELRYINSTEERAVAKLVLAVDRKYKNANGEKQTDFFNVIVWGKQAENASKYLAKGSLVLVQGEIQNRSYETQNKEKRYLTEIIAENIEFLSSGKNNNSGFDDGYRALENDDDVPF